MIFNYISRRNFIINSTVGAASLCLLRPSEILAEETRFITEQKNSVPKVWESILEIARFCPSPHNTQPWKLKFKSETEAELLLDHRRALPKEDTTGCFIICAVGMFAEACKIVGENLGHKVSFEEDYSKGESFSRIGTLRLVVGDAKESQITKYSNEIFEKRRTSRLRLRNEIASSSSVEELKQVASSFGHNFHHITDPRINSKILDINLHAVIEDMTNPKYGGEIVNWFRFGDAQARFNKDGLSSRCMNIPRPELYLMSHYAKTSNWPLLGPLVRARYSLLLGGAPQIGILSGDFFQESKAIYVGQGFMRLWLELAAHDLYIHPFGNLVTNEKAQKALVALTGIDKPWIVFRFGFSSIPPESYRLDKEELVSA